MSATESEPLWPVGTLMYGTIRHLHRERHSPGDFILEGKGKVGSDFFSVFSELLMFKVEGKVLIISFFKSDFGTIAGNKQPFHKIIYYVFR